MLQTAIRAAKLIRITIAVMYWGMTGIMVSLLFLAPKAGAQAGAHSYSVPVAVTGREARRVMGLPEERVCGEEGASCRGTDRMMIHLHRQKSGALPRWRKLDRLNRRDDRALIALAHESNLLERAQRLGIARNENE